MDGAEPLAGCAPAVAGPAIEDLDLVTGTALDRAVAHRGRVAHGRPAERSGSRPAPAQAHALGRARIHPSREGLTRQGHGSAGAWGLTKSTIVRIIVL